MRVWDKYLSERDKEVHALSGFSARTGFGKRPAVLIIDVVMVPLPWKISESKAVPPVMPVLDAPTLRVPAPVLVKVA